MAPAETLGDRSLSGWTPEQVKDALADRGMTLSELARNNGYSDCYLRNTLVRPLFIGEQIIAKFLGVDAKAIWPDRYNDEGAADYREWAHKRRSKVLALRQQRSAA